MNQNHYPSSLGDLVDPPSEMLTSRFDPAEQARHGMALRVPVGLSARATRSARRKT